MLRRINNARQVFYDPSTIGVEYWEVIDRAAALPKPITLSGSRLVVHIQTSPEAVEDFLSVIKTLKQEKIQAGFVPSKEQDVDSDGMRNVYVRNTRPSTPTPRTWSIYFFLPQRSRVLAVLK
jgi:threonine aldolase